MYVLCCPVNGFICFVLRVCELFGFVVVCSHVGG